jgi:lipid II:glycine glycyltransferase (peptidoglycan interpeptide bridge formation enzyme)
LKKSKIWNNIVCTLPGAHILHTWEWGEVKSQYNWTPVHLVWVKEDHNSQKINLVELSDSDIGKDILGNPARIVAVALVLMRSLPIKGFASKLRVLYLPKGPLVTKWGDDCIRKAIFSDLRKFARRQGAILIKIDPDVPYGEGISEPDEGLDDSLGTTVTRDITKMGWIFSNEQIQFKNTILVDLTPSEDELLMLMKQKTRYNIRLAERRGVTVRLGSAEDIDMLFDMYVETAARDGFVIRDEGYYRAVWNTYMRKGHNFHQDEEEVKIDVPIAEPLIAEVDGDPVAGLILFRFAKQAWYLYGMSRGTHRKLMPNYLLQWEAIRRAKVMGCEVYDLWGAPDEFNEMDPLWGVYRFKKGLGGKVVRTIGAWDYPIRPFYYRLYSQIIPLGLNMFRRRRTKQIQRITA